MLMVYLYTPLRVEPDQVLSSSLNPHSNLLNPNFTYQSLTGKSLSRVVPCVWLCHVSPLMCHVPAWGVTSSDVNRVLVCSPGVT